uniref:50S ribosomal protein L11, chloroplastic n=1 Tax=Tanacetum cinerariifolium TaxID=118510 RepID=A0A6L2MEF3_TANCI|nr:50S ribosomal protein L11, chloroplastic [Tanacetum cinerariifolium]
MPDLNCTTIESAMRIIVGTAVNMGIDEDRRKMIASAFGEDQGSNSVPYPIGLFSLIVSVGKPISVAN